MKEFFGIGGFSREPEGFLSWQHLLLVSISFVLMIGLAIFLGRRNKNRSDKEKNKVLIFVAFFVNAIEIFKVALICIVNSDPWGWKIYLPLFLCSMQFVALPLAAFSKGRLREATLDFIFIFGMLGATLGNIGAAQNFSSYPVLSYENIEFALTHAIFGFSALYIGVAGMKSMKRKNIVLTFSIVISFCAVAYIVNHIIDYNYMFLMRSDGTPYEVLYQLVNGNPVLYPLGVVSLFLLYMSAFYGVYYLVVNKLAKKKTDCEAKEELHEEVTV
ncbi:MAG: YwaF family protein [Oscillospiraceae bacterium]|nr:YwaF family protein [Oscillospiraceae bacterium]